jgi:hypothetical protein
LLIISQPTRWRLLRQLLPRSRPPLIPRSCTTPPLRVSVTSVAPLSRKSWSL